MKQMDYQPEPPEKRRGNRIRKTRKKSLRNCNFVFYTEQFINQHLFEGMSLTLAHAGHRLNLASNTDGIHSPAKLIDKSIDGIIFLGYPKRLLSTNILKKIPAVRVLGHKLIESYLCDNVTYNSDRVSEIAVNYLKSLGYKRFAAYYHRGIIAGEERLGLFELKARLAGIPVDNLGFEDQTKGYSSIPTDQVKELTASGNKPFGIFAFNDRIAAFLQMQLLSLGLNPEKDFHIISCNNERQILATLSPRPATIDLNFTDIGNRAAEQLLWRVENPESGVQTILLEPELIYPDQD
jgi:LacI family transcriptional regulator